MNSTILSFGEALWDLLPTGPALGGAPLNFAYRLNSLGHRSIIVSRLGKDEFGQKALKQIVSLGMEDTYLQWDETYPTGTVEIYFDKDKNPDYTIIENVAYDYIEFNADLENIIESADCICFGTLAQRNIVSRRTIQSLLSKFSGFSHALLEGESLNQACRLGNALGAMVAQQEGATQPISYKEALAFMETGCPGIVDRQLADYLQ